VEMRRAAHAPFLSHRLEFTAVLEQFLRAGEVDAGTAAADVRTTTTAPPTAEPDIAQPRATKKKRMKARARKKLQASSR